MCHKSTKNALGPYGSTLFAKVPVERFLVHKGLITALLTIGLQNNKFYDFTILEWILPNHPKSYDHI